MSLLDLIFPKRCVNCRHLGSYICSACFARIAFIDHGVCIVCQKATLDGLTHPICRSRYSIDGVFSSVVYSGVMKRLIYNFKYRPFITDLQSILVDLFYEGLIQKEQFYPLVSSENIFVPVPLHKSKMKKRGYNQSLLLAQGVAQHFGGVVTDMLERVKNTQTQVGLPQKKRQENIKDAFQVRRKELVTMYNNVFLVDDIVTSGSTLAEATKVLKQAGVEKVWGITLAHGE